MPAGLSASRQSRCLPYLQGCLWVLTRTWSRTAACQEAAGFPGSRQMAARCEPGTGRIASVGQSRTAQSTAGKQRNTQLQWLQ